MSIKPSLVTLQVGDLVADLLQDKGCVPVHRSVAESILLVCKNTILCHVQFPTDIDCEVFSEMNGGSKMQGPILWEIGYWQFSTEKWLREKKRSNDRRNEQFVLDENVRRVSKRLKLNFPSLSDDNIRSVARRYVMNKDERALEYFKVGKLATKIEEI